MKKTMIMLLAASAALLSSCGMNTAKLETQTDSLSYALGYTMGASYDEGLISKSDDPKTAEKVFLEAIKDIYENAPTSPEDIEAQAKLAGKQIGESINMMDGQPIWNGAKVNLNKEMAIQGLINALKKQTNTLDNAAAEELIQKAMQEIMKQNMEAAAPAEPQLEEAPATDTTATDK